MEALLWTREVLRREMALLHRELLRIVQNDELCRRFMSIPGVGPVTALAFETTIDRPDRFRRSSDVGAHLGLTPKQHQSGETDRRGRITRCGDGLTRNALFAAANVMLGRSHQWTALKAWGVRLAKRGSLKKPEQLLVVDLHAFPSQQQMQAPVPEAAALVRHLAQPASHTSGPFS